MGCRVQDQCSGSEEGSYVRLRLLCHSTLGKEANKSSESAHGGGVEGTVLEGEGCAVSS